MYTQSLHGETMYEYKLLMSTFDNQSMSIDYVGKLGHLFGFLWHYLLILVRYTFEHPMFHKATV